MPIRPFSSTIASALAALALFSPGLAHPDGEADVLVGAMLGQTPLLDDLRELCDTIGGRSTGSAANEAAIEWALETFEQAGVSATAEEFEMPMQWQEIAVSAAISGDVAFRPRVVAKPFSTGTAEDGLRARLVDAGKGTADDFASLGAAARGAWVLIETPVLDDEIGLAGLFAEYTTPSGSRRRQSVRVPWASFSCRRDRKTCCFAILPAA